MKKLIIVGIFLCASIFFATTFAEVKFYGPIKKTDTLWQIANYVRPNKSVSAQQVMIAILDANPRAFKDKNINGIETGFYLHVPNLSKIKEISKINALKKIKEQNETWVKYMLLQTQIQKKQLLNKLLILQNENQKFLSRLNRQLLFTKYTVLAYIKTYDARIKILERRSNLLIPKLQKTNYKLQGLYKKVWIIQEETSTYYRYLFLVSMIIFVFLILLVFLIVYKNRKPLNKTIEKEEYDFLSSKESISVKLDLVRAYIEMEEEESAIKVLKEIMEEGNKKQKEEAKKMLDQLNKN